MSLSILSNSQAVLPGNTTPFSGTGGTAPYVYSVVGGGAGGSINPSTGMYTAGVLTGSDTILVTDAALATATKTVYIMNALELFCDILQVEMGLAAGRVYLWDQKINSPNDNDLFITVGVVSCKPFANSNQWDGTNSVQSVNMFATLSVDVNSRGPAARDRKEEVILALNSNYAQTQQELNGFYIAKVSSGFANLSQEDGAAIPYRFNISVNIQYAVKKIKAVGYYDTFAPVYVSTDP